MAYTSELKNDLLLSHHSVSAKQGHFGSSTEYLAAERRVVYRTWGARRRLWGLLPPRQIPPTVLYLDIPEEITTEDALWDYVKNQKSNWLHGSHRRR